MTLKDVHGSGAPVHKWRGIVTPAVERQDPAFPDLLIRGMALSVGNFGSDNPDLTTEIAVILLCTRLLYISASACPLVKLV